MPCTIKATRASAAPLIASRVPSTATTTNARVAGPAPTRRSAACTPSPPIFEGIMDHLDRLENQSIFIIREAFNKIERLAMLWSVGKDSQTILWLARNAFFGHVPFPCVFMETSFDMPELIELRDRLTKEWKLNLIIARNDEALAQGMNHKLGRVVCCSALLKENLKKTVDKYNFGGLIVGVRRDEDPTRAKERYFSPRDKNMEWNVEDKPPELWDQFNTDLASA